jgi:hypothetical protein
MRGISRTVRQARRTPSWVPATEDGTILYPRDDLALRHGAGVETDTEDPHVAYAPFGHSRPGRPDASDELPWSTSS